MKISNIAVPLIFIFTLFQGCIQTPEPDTPKHISFLYLVEEMGSDIVVNEDTLVVDEIKLLADKFNLSLANGNVLQTNIDALVFTYRSQFDGEYENVLSANIGYEDIDRFNGLDLFINPPGNNDNIQDSDFFGDPSNFSFIMRGTYNSQSFEYKSNTSFEKNFDFGNTIELTNSNETLIIRVLLNAGDIVIDESQNTILNPSDPANKSKIDSLLKDKIAIDAFAADVL